MPQEKYPEKCPWDFGPDQNMSHLSEWTLMNGPDSVRFSKDPTDKYWFLLRHNDQDAERIPLFRARLTYKKLLDKGFRLIEI